MEARRPCSRKKLASGRGRAESGRTCTSTAPDRQRCLTASSFSCAGTAVHPIVEVLSFSVETRSPPAIRSAQRLAEEHRRTIDNDDRTVLSRVSSTWPSNRGRLFFLIWFFGGSTQRMYHVRSRRGRASGRALVASCSVRVVSSRCRKCLF